MRGAIDYQQRAEQCIARAEGVADPTDRARWLQLAEQWALLSRIRFERLPGTRNQPGGLWRGEGIVFHPERQRR